MATTQTIGSADTIITRCGKCGQEFTSAEILALCPHGTRNTFGTHHSFSCPRIKDGVKCGSSVDACRDGDRFLTDTQLRALARARLANQTRVHLGIASSAAAAARESFSTTTGTLDLDLVAAHERARVATAEYEAETKRPAGQTPKAEQSLSDRLIAAGKTLSTGAIGAARARFENGNFTESAASEFSAAIASEFSTSPGTRDDFLAKLREVYAAMDEACNQLCGSRLAEGGSQDDSSFNAGVLTCVNTLKELASEYPTSGALFLTRAATKLETTIKRGGK